MLLGDQLAEKIENGLTGLRQQLESNLDPVETAEARGKIKAFRAVLKMIQNIEAGVDNKS